MFGRTKESLYFLLLLCLEISKKDARDRTEDKSIGSTNQDGNRPPLSLVAVIEDRQDAEDNNEGQSNVHATGAQQIGMIVEGQLFQDLGGLFFGQVGAQQRREEEGGRDGMLPGVDQVDST